LPSAKLFTDLDKLNKGDRFVIRVLDEVYTYEVDRILIVQPDDLSGLTIENGMDYCTLVTCTPYAVNTHRLLVRGHRVENDKEAKQVKVTSDAMQIEPIVVAPIVAAPMLLILFVVMMVTTSKGKNKSKK
jgi:sortase A